MLFKPKWVKSLPSNLRPDEKRINELEKLRLTFNIPHEDYYWLIMSSLITTRRVQRNCYETFRIQNPEASEKELFRMVLLSRILSPPEIEMTEQEINNAMQDINSFDDLCDYIIKLDKEESSFEGPLGIGKRLDEILSQDEIDKKAPSDNLIKALEQTYFDLMAKNPHRDEHWLLANTWLERYGSSEQAKQKGAEWAKFVAYKDTHQFSILESPKSIRGLALFLVYKELGDQQAIYYASEFSQIMQPIISSKQSHTFLDKYKERNIRTWEENQVENDSPYSLYWFFRGLKFQQENPEEAAKALSESEIIRKMQKDGKNMN